MMSWEERESDLTAVLARWQGDDGSVDNAKDLLQALRTPGEFTTDARSPQRATVRC
jgi:hypothetical protein